MSKKEIPTDAIERNRAWIKAVTNALKTRGDTEFSRIAMRDAGKRGKVTTVQIRTQK